MSQPLSYFDKNLQAPLSKKIRTSYQKLVTLVTNIPIQKIEEKNISFSQHVISIKDIIAYQVGWGSLLIQWYQNGLKQAKQTMPEEACNNWQYHEIAKYFFEKYKDQSIKELLDLFEKTVLKILSIVEKEHQAKHLDALDIWNWCKLKNGKSWPLSKWVQVNTVAPYERACKLIKASQKSNCVS